MSDTKIASPVIDKIVALTVHAGNVVKIISGDWKPRQVIFMDRPLAASTKSEIPERFPEVEAFSSEATPHNPATEGYIDRSTDVAIAFPTPGETRRWY